MVNLGELVMILDLHRQGLTVSAISWSWTGASGGSASAGFGDGWFGRFRQRRVQRRGTPDKGEASRKVGTVRLSGWDQRRRYRRDYIDSLTT